MTDPCLEDDDPVAPTTLFWWWDLRRLLEASAFERTYADRSNLTVEFLRSWGRWPEPCDCGYEAGPHWRMGYQWEDAIVMDECR